MTRIYRIARRRFAKDPFDGEGSYRFGGRWSSPGTRLAYAAEHLSLAMLEYLVHIDIDDAPGDLIAIAADVPDDVSRQAVSLSELPSHWRETPPPTALAAIGDDFVRRSESAIFVVPSAIAPIESNWLINPAHRDFARIRVNAPEPFAYDRRFFRA